MDTNDHSSIKNDKAKNINIYIPVPVSDLYPHVDRHLHRRVYNKVLVQGCRHHTWLMQ